MRTQGFALPLFAAVAALIILAPPVLAQQDSSGRFAQRSEVIGYWKLVAWPESLKATNAVDPWPAPFQYFAFFDNGGFVSHMSTQETNDTPETLKQVYDILPKTAGFRFENGFMAVTYADRPGERELWGVNVITRKVERDGFAFLPGDLLMSLDDGAGNAVYRRHLRRIGK
jgi:hypothetical protein